MSDKKMKLAWYSGGVLIFGLSILFVSCTGLVKPTTPPLPVAVIVPPLIPHPLEGWADCRVCHATGFAGAPQMPSNHSERPSDVCLSCHAEASVSNGDSAPQTKSTSTTNATTTPSPAVKTAVAVILAKELYSAKCAACHGANRQGIPGFASALTPESLVVFSDNQIRGVIADGKPGTAMPAFKGSLTTEEINALLQFIKNTSP